VTREGGPTSWLDAAKGKQQGVDLKNSTMNNFIGQQVLPDLLVMQRVGVFVDRQPIPDDATKASNIGHPYLYVYKVEDIMSWTYDGPWDFKTLLLRDWEPVLDAESGLPTKKPIARYKLLTKLEDAISVRFFDRNGQEDAAEQILKITKIPFVLFELTDSLMRDVANYQIALLNMGSSDVAFCLKGNFPFYTEQTNPFAQGGHLKKPGSTDNDDDDTITPDDEIKAGVMHGRNYPKGVERPGFIAPPTDPLQASMAKQAELKDDIRLLVNLALSNMKSSASSAESKSIDERGLEAGLSYIGMELEYGERRIARIWSLYLNKDQQPTVRYPERYSLKSDAALLAEAKDLEDRMMAIPSDSYKREIAKKIASTMLGNSVSLEMLSKINQEIDDAEVLTTDPDVIEMMVTQALLGNKAAAKALGARESEPALAAVDHAERAARILAAQTKAADAARGVKDTDPNPNSAKDEKNDSQNQDIDFDGKRKVRGKGK